MRNIVNAEGVIIGTLTLPDGTPESEWTRVLNSYVVSVKTSYETNHDKIITYRRLAPQLITELLAEYNVAGITTVQLDALFDDYRDVFDRLNAGDFTTALLRLNAKLPLGFITLPLLESWKIKINLYL